MKKKSGPDYVSINTHRADEPPRATAAALADAVDRADMAVEVDGRKTSEYWENFQQVVPKRLSDEAPYPQPWLWTNYVPCGNVTVLAGEPGIGKSLIALNLAARLSSSRAWPDGTIMPEAPKFARMRQPGSMILSAEDNASYVVVPRLIKAGADLSKIYTPNYMQFPESAILFPRDAERLFYHCQGSEIGLVIVDHGPAFFGKPFTDDRQRTPTAAHSLNDLAREMEQAVLVIVHVSKTRYHSAIHRVLGHPALAVMARSVLMAVADRSEENTDPSRRLLVSVKNSYGPPPKPLAYRVRDQTIEWLGPAHEGADRDALIHLAPQRPGPDPTHLEKAIEWLIGELAPGPQPYRKIMAKGVAAGFSQRTLLRAKESVAIKSVRIGLEAWNWALAEAPPPGLLRSGSSNEVRPVQLLDAETCWGAA
ncbi:MAG: AAA family ATPase [Phycisphaerales bacterium]|nr:AAA family ATPase [Phycisphaerales bacterium]